MSYQNGFGSYTDLKGKTLSCKGMVLDANGNLKIKGNAKINGHLQVNAGIEGILTLDGGNVDILPPEDEGTLIYNIDDQKVYVSDGTVWNLVGQSALSLPPPLQSIAGLTTNGNELLFTTGINTYDLTPVTAFTRSLLSQSTVNGAQSILQIIPGSQVQPYSFSLETIALLAPFNIGDMLYSVNASSFGTVSTTSFGRSLLNESNASTFNATLGTIVGPVSTVDRLIKVSGSNSVIETGIAVDTSNNISGVNDLSVNGSINVVGDLDGITAAERTQLQKIDGTVISSTQWGYVGAMDQSVASTSTPTFNGSSMNNSKITSVLNPTSGQDAATKDYVDTVASSGAPPLDSVNFASITVLPNAPVYANTSQTITSTAGAGTALTIDGITLVVGDNGKRLLVKNQGNTRENGVYVVTDYGGGGNPWQLTRSSDFNQAAMPLLAGTTTFVLILEGGTNDGSSWSLKSAIATIDPLTDSVDWVQIGGLKSFSAGNGIDSSLLGTGTIEVLSTARFTFTGNSELELDTVSTEFGGTGLVLTAGDTNKFLTTHTVDGTNPMQIVKDVPTGNVIGDSDVQTLTNKDLLDSSNDIRASYLGTTGSSVNVDLSGVPSVGQALIATGAASAIWQDLPGQALARVVNVAQSGGDYTSITDALNDIGVGIVAPVVPISPNGNVDPLLIYVAPGTYYETNPLVVPPYVAIVGSSATRTVFVVPTVPNQPVFSLMSTSMIEKMEIINNGTNPPGDGTMPLAGIIGVRASYGTGKAAICKNIVVNRCSIGFQSVGTGTSKTSLLIAVEPAVAADGAAPAITTDAAFEASNGGTIIMYDGLMSTVNNGVLSRGINVSGTSDTNRGSIASYSLDVSFASTVLYAGSFGTLQIMGGYFRFFSSFGLDMLSNAEVTIFSAYFKDDTDIFPSQMHFRTAGPGTLRGVGLVARNDLTQLDSNTIVIGNSLNLRPGEPQMNILGELSVGFPNVGYESSFGHGDSTTISLVGFQYDSIGASYNDVTSLISIDDNTSAPVFVNNSVGDIFYIGNDTSFFNLPFSGIVIVIPSGLGVVPSSGRLNAVEPPTYYYNWEYYDGTTWREFSLMNTDRNSPYLQHRRNTLDAGSFQYRFSTIDSPGYLFKSSIGSATGISSTIPASGTYWFDSGTLSPFPQWATTSVNGVTGYWIRIRLNTVLTTVPQIGLVKLHTDRTEINEDGFIEYFGKAQNTDLGDYNLSDFKPDPSAPPTNQNLYLSDFIGLTLTNNSFSGTNDNRISIILETKNKFDTSKDFILRWKWVTFNSGSSTVRWTIRWGYTKDYNSGLGLLNSNQWYATIAQAPTAGQTQRSIVFDTATPGQTRAQVETFCRLDISDVNLSDLIWISLERTGSADAYNQSVYLADARIEYTKWTQGRYNI